MAYEVHITRTAERDIIGDADYIEYVLFNSTAADHLLDEIEQTASSLTVFPERYQTIDDQLLKSWGIRFAKVGRYLMFYIISENNKNVFAIRFLFSKRDWNSILKSGFSLE